MRSLPIRLRVTLTFAAVMAIVLAAVGLFVYLRLEAQLDESIDNGLRSRATEVSALARGASEGGLSAGVSPLIEQDESFAEILSADGRLLDASPQIQGAVVLSDSELTQAASAPTFHEMNSIPGVEGPVRVLAVPVEISGRRLVVVVGSSLGDRNEALDGLAKLMLIGGLAALLLASLAGYGAAAAALRPVDAMRRRAAEISASEPGERLPVPPADDELSRLGETLNAMLARLEATLERERRFVDDASHELRTPLALHKIELELALRHSAGADELRAAIASATEEIDRLIQLAEHLLVVARSENGKVEIHKAHFAVADVFEAIQERFAARADQAGTSVTYELPAEGLALEADRSRVEQALTNMVENALRHGGGPVRLFARTSDDGSIELHVTDEGPGMPPEFVGQAFERFSRADAARARGGTGLGLAIVDSIAAAHGGTADIVNRPEAGVDIWITLPGGA